MASGRSKIDKVINYLRRSSSRNIPPIAKSKHTAFGVGDEVWRGAISTIAICFSAGLEGGCASSFSRFFGGFFGLELLSISYKKEHTNA